MRIGFHVSIAGGFARSVRRAKDLGCTCMQIFSRNPRGWAAKPLDALDVEGFRTLREREDIGPVFVHTNYLINLASPREDLYAKSIEQFVLDLNRTEQLGAEYLVIHPGSARGKEPAWMIDRVSRAMNRAVQRHRLQTTILLENTAGEAGDVGYSLEQLQGVISRFSDPSRIGICYDTCHGFAAGYDIRTGKGVAMLARKIEATVGLERLRGIHLNDCLRDFNAHIDRHWHIGEGKIGRAGFRELLNRREFAEIPVIMETPKKSDGDDARNMQTVKALIRQRSGLSEGKNRLTVFPPKA